MSILRSLEFVTTVAEPQGLPPPSEPEIAFAGRSNAGKSSVINALAGRNRLAFVSKTPGRTQHINFFKVGSLGYLVDLPGYGYAKVPEAARAHWNELIGGYLQTRASLRGVILIMDARHPFTALDDQLLAWLRPTGLPIHILLSKCDKLTPAQGRNTLHNVTSLLQGNALYSAQLFSSTRKIGIVEATAQIARWLTAENIKNPRLKGSKTGGKALIRIKAPAQGGKAGDDKIA